MQCSGENTMLGGLGSGRRIKERAHRGVAKGGVDASVDKERGIKSTIKRYFMVNNILELTLKPM